MKKILSICLCILLLVGCGKKEEKPSPAPQKPVDNTAILEEKLVEYGKTLYESSPKWTNGNIEPAIYYTTLEEMKRIYGFDTSMFVNFKTNEKCNAEETRIEFIVTSKKSETKTKYTFKPVLSC